MRKNEPYFQCSLSRCRIHIAGHIYAQVNSNDLNLCVRNFSLREYSPYGSYVRLDGLLVDKAFLEWLFIKFHFGSSLLSQIVFFNFIYPWPKNYKILILPGKLIFSSFTSIWVKKSTFENRLKFLKIWEFFADVSSMTSQMMSSVSYKESIHQAITIR